MTEQELRDKIVKILEEYRDWFIEEDYKRDIAKIDYTGIANALIEAGIGDISEYKHRAERAERALRKIVEDDRAGCLDEKKAVKEMFYFYLKQAEKELAEEGKNERRNVNV